MPPLFLYAVAFLTVLTVVGFVVCCSEGRTAGSETAPALPPEAKPALPLQRRGASAVAGARSRPSAPAVSNAPLRSAHPQDRGVTALAPLTGSDRPLPRYPASGTDDALVRHVSLLVEHVAELKADQHALKAEIRGLRAALRNTGAAGALAA